MTGPSETHDVRDDYDDSVVEPATLPVTVNWAGICWNIFALFNSLVTVYGGIVVCLTVTRPHTSAVAYCLSFFILAVFLTLTVAFGIMGHDARAGILPNLKTSLFWSRLVAGVLLVAWGAFWGLVLLMVRIQDIRLEGFLMILVTFLYLLPALAGSVLGSMGEQDYLKWRQRKRAEASSEAQSDRKE